MMSALLFMLGIGVLCGIVLSLSSRIFYVYEDPKIELVENNLAGANCGGCGYAGCSAAAQAIVKGDEPASLCVISDKEGVENVAQIMGVDVSSAEAALSYNLCEGGKRSEDKFYYMGIFSCSAMAVFFGGKRLCSVGCIGYGDCVAACKFNALKIGSNGYPVVNEEKCVGCGACRNVCPKNIIEVKTLSEKLMHFNHKYDALAPCSQTCPAEINIPKYISQIKQGKYKEAVQTIRMRNPLPLSCGRVCPHPCEDDCRRGIEDEPVSINQLKRFASDYEMNTNQRIPIKCAPDTGKKVAVIGGGPAGLSCSFFLRRLGYDVSIFEAMPKLGGMLRYGIPEYRLPKKVLDWEIQGILNLGVKDYCHVRFGVDFGIGSLIAGGYSAVFLGLGAWKDYSIGIKGEDMKGCYTGIDFLQRISNDEDIPIGRKAAVIGGGNTAVDCARTLLRLGSDKVYMVYRRTRKEMPANEVEIVASEQEGIEFVFLAAPAKIIGDDDKVTHLEYLKMKLGAPDSSGRRRPEPIEGSETLLEIDMIISAIGQSPDVSFREREGNAGVHKLQLTRWDTIDNDPATLRASIPYIFTGGDVATGPALVIDAIGGGRRAARSIDLFLKNKPVKPIKESLQNSRIPESIFTKVDGIKQINRARMPEISVQDRLDSFVEVDLVLPEQKALQEAQRCLNCCRICYDPDIKS